jgi:hypothetical protein
MEMGRIVRYKRHEFRFDPETRGAPLWAFLYDILHLAACGIFPPRHLLNMKLKTGGGDSGMSPGASWEPFEVSETEYAETVAQVLNADRAALERYARYIDQVWTLDPTFDHYTDRLEWLSAVCAKHRSAYHARLKGREA